MHAVYYDVDTDSFVERGVLGVGGLRSYCLRVGTLCNMNCLYCLSESGRGGEMFHISTILRVLSSMRLFGPSRVVFSGGEPFLHGGLREMLYFSKSIGNYNVVATNGLKLCGECLQYVDWVMVSCPTLDRLVSMKLRNFDGVMLIEERIQFLVAAGVRVCVYIPVCRDNVAGLSGLVAHCFELGVKKIIVGQILPIGFGGNVHALTEAECREMCRCLCSKFAFCNLLLPSEELHDALNSSYLVMLGNGEVESPSSMRGMSVDSYCFSSALCDLMHGMEVIFPVVSYE